MGSRSKWYRGIPLGAWIWSCFGLTNTDNTARIIVAKWFRGFVKRRAKETAANGVEERAVSSEESYFEEDVPEVFSSFASVSSKESSKLSSTEPSDTWLSRSKVKGKRLSVRFQFPEEERNDDQRRNRDETTTEEDDDWLEKCRKFFRKPSCKIITCLLFGVLLPCLLIYPGMYYLHQKTKARSCSGQEKSKRSTPHTPPYPHH